MKKTTFFSIAILLAMFIISAFMYALMPDMMITHFDAKGDPNGYMPKLSGLLIIPVMAAVLFAVLFIVPSIDPLKKNIDKFRSNYNWFILLFLGFMLTLHLLIIIFNFGIFVNIFFFIMPIIALIMYSSGILMEKSKRNYFIGFRTPWTLSNDFVWEKTNQAGGKFFKAIALLCLLLIFISSEAAFFVLITFILAGTIGITAYSYIIFLRISKNKNPQMKTRKVKKLRK